VADDRVDHRSGASACRRRTPAKRGPNAQGLGRSRGGLRTKIHADGDAFGNPVRLIGSPGQRNDIAFVHDLIDDLRRGRHHRRQRLRRGPPLREDSANPRRGRHPAQAQSQLQAPYGAELDKERNIIERFFNTLKQLRRVATRYDKLLANFMGFVKLAAIWLK
jgi:putative transposase